MYSNTTSYGLFQWNRSAKRHCYYHLQNIIIEFWCRSIWSVHRRREVHGRKSFWQFLSQLSYRLSPSLIRSHDQSATLFTYQQSMAPSPGRCSRFHQRVCSSLWFLCSTSESNAIWLFFPKEPDWNERSRQVPREVNFLTDYSMKYDSNEWFST